MSDIPSQHQHITNKARADKFLMVITLPKVLRNLNAQLLSRRTQDFIQEGSLQFSVYGVTVPGVSVPSTELRYDGQPYQVTTQSRKTYDPVQVNFTIDNYFNNYWLLWKWLDKMNKIRPSGMDEHFHDQTIEGNKGNLDGNKYTDYQTKITVYGLDEYNIRVVRFDYTNAFITDLGEIRYSYRDEQELETFFTFVFNQMDITLLEGGTPAGQ